MAETFWEAELNDARKLDLHRRDDGPILPDGCTRPYRPCPADFAERFIELGQGKEIEEHYRTNWRVICRWIEECGGDDLRARRYAASGGFARPNKRARRYILGMTMTAVSKRTKKA